MADKKQEAIADVVRKMRNEIAELRKVSPNVPSVAADWWEARADEIEAAHRREKAAIEADALAVGGIVEAERKRELSKNTSKNGADFGQLGDAAKLREALGYILKYADSVACRDHDEHTRHYIDQIRKWAQSALAAPAKNCDRFLTLDDAKHAYSEYLQGARRRRMAGLDVEALDEIDWCYAPAEGGNDGNE